MQTANIKMQNDDEKSKIKHLYTVILTFTF